MQMARKKITDLVDELLTDFLEQEGYELYSSEFVKEGKDWFLRIYIDRAGGEGYIGTEDCEKISRYLSDRLDEEDPIEQNYYLEVSSPGMDRELIKPEHYMRFAGSEVEVRLYRSIDGVKNINGTLEGIEDDKVRITGHDGREWILAPGDIAKTRLAVIF